MESDLAKFATILHLLLTVCVLKELGIEKLSIFRYFESAVGFHKTDKHRETEQAASQVRECCIIFGRYSSAWSYCWYLQDLKEFCILQDFLWRVVSHHLKDSINFH